MSHTATKQPDQYAKMRTQAEHARQHYQAAANRELAAAVEKERRYLQAQVDATIAEAQAAIERALAEADHWMSQCEEVYRLMEESAQLAEAEIGRLAGEVARLQKDNDRLRALKSKAGKSKRLMNRD